MVFSQGHRKSRKGHEQYGIGKPCKLNHPTDNTWHIHINLINQTCVFHDQIPNEYGIIFYYIELNIFDISFG